MRSSAAALAALVLLAACGGSSPRPATDGDFQDIQRAEARMDRALHTLRDTSVECPARCDALAEARLAPNDTCALGERIEDHDVAARCNALRRNLSEAEALAAECACAPPTSTD